MINLATSARGDLRNVTCRHPYDHLEIQEDGAILQCCKTWMPRSVGNILRTSVLDAYWGKQAQEARQSVDDGSFRHCIHSACPYLSNYIHSGKALAPLEKKNGPSFPQTPENEGFFLNIALNYDRSCNLSCPSCRSEKVLYRTETLPPTVGQIHTEVLKNVKELRKAGMKLRLYVTGGGDAFASPTFFRMLYEMPYDPGIQIAIKTNGTLMSPSRFTEAMKKMICSISVSVDAFSKETYAKVRRGGSFEAMRANMHWLDQAINMGEFPNLIDLHLNFVVQKENYEEMPEFTRWATSYSSVNQVFFSLIRDWKALPKKVFNDQAIWMRSHPEYPRFLKAAQHPFLRSNPCVNLGDLTPFSSPRLAPRPSSLGRLLFRLKQASPGWAVVYRALGSVSWTTNQLRTSHGRSAFVARWKRRLHLGISPSRR